MSAKDFSRILLGEDDGWPSFLSQSRLLWWERRHQDPRKVVVYGCWPCRDRSSSTLTKAKPKTTSRSQASSLPSTMGGESSNTSTRGEGSKSKCEEGESVIQEVVTLQARIRLAHQGKQLRWSQSKRKLQRDVRVGVRRRIGSSKGKKSISQAHYLYRLCHFMTKIIDFFVRIHNQSRWRSTALLSWS